MVPACHKHLSTSISVSFNNFGLSRLLLGMISPGPDAMRSRGFARQCNAPAHSFRSISIKVIQVFALCKDEEAHRVWRVLVYAELFPGLKRHSSKLEYKKHGR